MGLHRSRVEKRHLLLNFPERPGALILQAYMPNSLVKKAAEHPRDSGLAAKCRQTRQAIWGLGLEWYFLIIVLLFFRSAVLSTFGEQGKLHTRTFPSSLGLVRAFQLQVLCLQSRRTLNPINHSALDER